MRDFRKIMAWEKADDLVVLIYEATKAFPREELYGLTSQLR
jgi:four helix bundle protein